MKYVADRYSLPTVVIDGYENQNVSSKHQEHLRRNTIPLSAFQKISEDVRIVYSRDQYFSLLANKQAFVTYLAEIIRKNTAKKRQPRKKVCMLVANKMLCMLLIYPSSPASGRLNPKS